MMKSSCRAGLHRELLNSTPSAFHPAKRISGMHLKPYLKFQKKERPLEISPDPPRSPPMSQERLANEEKPNRARPGLSPTRPLRKALEGLSPNTICGGNHGGSPVEGPSVKERSAALPATIHQGDDGEGPLDIWAVVKPGNTKEKIAFFAGQQCRDHRVSSSMKNKSTWDIDRRATKRRKKSLDQKKAKIQLERMREASGRCHQPEPFACGIEHCSVHNVNDGGEGGFPSRPLSVVEMVAFLEQRASVLLVGCAKNCPGASAVTRCPVPPKGASPAPGPFPILAAYEAHSEKAPGGGGGDGEQPGEPVRVLDMVAKLESECLRRQSEREAGSLSRNNSFRRNVGRVLLASGVPPENEAGKGAAEALHGEEQGGEGEEEAWRSKRSPLEEGGLSAAPLPTPFPEGLSGTGGRQLEPGDSAPSGERPAPQKIAKLRQAAARPEAAQPSPRSLQSQNAAVACTPKEPVALPNLNSNVRARESLSISISAAKTEKGYREAHPAVSGFGQDSLPGRLFLLLSECEVLPERVASGEAPAEECQGKAASPGDDPVSHVAGEPPGSPLESALQVPDSSRLKRQRSHDFLETRFKIQQLLEPQQYLAFLPHHIIVKIFGLLPTRSLVALKCTCGYFKFIIEYYNIRPADSRWVRDPRYREDPCKQCKKKYSKGDVSLCRWHPKPYCQALPYGPGYWMCCHRSQKSVPGCKLGLHDNHWVPACHSFNRTLHKKPRETEDDC